MIACLETSLAVAGCTGFGNQIFMDHVLSEAVLTSRVMALFVMLGLSVFV